MQNFAVFDFEADFKAFSTFSVLKLHRSALGDEN